MTKMAQWENLSKQFFSSRTSFLAQNQSTLHFENTRNNEGGIPPILGIFTSQN